jgi:two-component system, sensor histidine kinase PdtaS
LRWALGGGLLLAALFGLAVGWRYRAQRAANRRLQAQEAAIAAQNESLIRTQSQLQQSLGEKEVLLKEVHHRVKNNLQIIASLLALQALEHTQNSAVTEAFQEGQNRIQTIALIHQLLYQSTNLSQIDLREFLDQLIAYLARAYALPDPPPVASDGQFTMYLARSEGPQPVTLTIETANVYLTTSTAVPLGLLINELLSNAYQHAFVDGRAGHIGLCVSAPDDDDTYTLTVSDNGVGLPPHVTPNAALSLGLRLVDNLARQLQGHCAVESSSAGTRFRITFQEIAEHAPVF